MEAQKSDCPAISVIIPLYNVEQYVGECLDSLLTQTFQNFEIIVVDDGSTDSSPAVVESYAPKFGGRLRLMHTEKNSGGCAVPRNVGLPFSRGEYLYFMDADDTITPTAFEELYTAAKKFDADLVRCEKYYEVPQESWHDAEFRKQLKPYNYLTGEKIFVTEPLIWTDNFEERIKFFSQRKLMWNVFVQLVRRDLMFGNKIKFCDIFAEDMIFTICGLCSAKKYVVLPNVFYNYRIRKNSISTAQTELTSRLFRQLKALKIGVKYLDDFWNGREFFSRRPDLKHALLSVFVNEMLDYFQGIYTKIPAYAIDEILRKEFTDGDNTALTTFIFGAMNVYRSQLVLTKRRIAVLENEMQSDRRQLIQAQQRIAALEKELHRVK